jgi:hypothetical protein
MQEGNVLVNREALTLGFVENNLSESVQIPL